MAFIRLPIRNWKAIFTCLQSAVADIGFQKLVEDFRFIPSVYEVQAVFWRLELSSVVGVDYFTARWISCPSWGNVRILVHNLPIESGIAQTAVAHATACIGLNQRSSETAFLSFRRPYIFTFPLPYPCDAILSRWMTSSSRQKVRGRLNHLWFAAIIAAKVYPTDAG